MRTQKDILLKDGSTLAKGLPVTFIEGKDSRCLVHSPAHSEPLQVRITSAHYKRIQSPFHGYA
jgi:hypothetical protein